MVEQLTCNQQVVGSIPITSSIFFGKVAERPNATDCKSVDYVFDGSNPSLPTKLKRKRKCFLFLNQNFSCRGLKYLKNVDLP